MFREICIQEEICVYSGVIYNTKNNLRLQALPNTVFKSINKCKLSFHMTSENAVAAAFGVLPMLGKDLKLHSLNPQLLCQELRPPRPRQQQQQQQQQQPESARLSLGRTALIFPAIAHILPERD